MVSGEPDSMLYRKLLKICEIPNTPENPIFDELWNTVRKYIRDQPDDSIILNGPGVGYVRRRLFQGRTWMGWVIGYLDSGIGQKYWGPVTQGRWKIDRDRA